MMVEKEAYLPEGLLLSDEENRIYTGSPAGLEKAMLTGRICEARATLCTEAHDLIVELFPGARGIIPRNECAVGIEEGRVRDIAVITRVGKPVCFKVMQLLRGTDGLTALLSRRAAQQECTENYIAALQPGQVIDARVTHLEHFGCFTDIGCGLVALMPIDCISVSRIAHPRERFTVGQYIKCAVRSIDRAAGRVAVTQKELLGTWQENAAGFAPGQTAAGIIRGVEPYGIFVELAPNLAGLAEWHAGAETGQQAAVYIKSILPEKMKIKLVLIDACFAGLPPPELRYFISSGRIEKWVYSPPGAYREISTDFTGEL